MGKSISLLIFLSFQILNAQFQNIMVNKPSSQTPEKVTIAINPNNPNILAAGANIDFFF